MVLKGSMMNVYTTLKSRNKKFWQIFKRFLTNRDKIEDKDWKNGENEYGF